MKLLLFLTESNTIIFFSQVVFEHEFVEVEEQFTGAAHLRLQRSLSFWLCQDNQQRVLLDVRRLQGKKWNTPDMSLRILI